MILFGFVAEPVQKAINITVESAPGPADIWVPIVAAAVPVILTGLGAYLLKRKKGGGQNARGQQEA